MPRFVSLMCSCKAVWSLCRALCAPLRAVALLDASAGEGNAPRAPVAGSMDCRVQSTKNFTNSPFPRSLPAAMCCMREKQQQARSAALRRVAGRTWIRRYEQDAYDALEPGPHMPGERGGSRSALPRRSVPLPQGRAAPPRPDVRPRRRHSKRYQASAGRCGPARRSGAQRGRYVAR